MGKLDIEGLVRKALKDRRDPYLLVMEEMNNRLLEKGKVPWRNIDRSMVKMFTLGFLYARDLEVDGENRTLREITDE